MYVKLLSCDDAFVYQVTLMYLEKIRSSGRDKQGPCIIIDLDLGAGVTKSIRDTLSSDDAYTGMYQASLIYHERIRIMGVTRESLWTHRQPLYYNTTRL